MRIHAYMRARGKIILVYAHKYGVRLCVWHTDALTGVRSCVRSCVRCALARIIYPYIIFFKKMVAMMKLNRAEFAKSRGVHPSTVTRWIQDGRISLDINGKIDSAAAEIDLSKTASHEPHHEARRAQLADERHQKSIKTDRESSARDDVASRHRAARMRREEAQADMAEMERQKMSGTLVERAEVDFLLRDLGAVIQSQIQAMPYRLAPQLLSANGADAINAVLDSAAHDLLTEISNEIERRSAQ